MGAQIYVAGFAFNDDGDSLWLIQKTKPEWQKGRYNGIGGKVEQNEAPMIAMIREFKEETGLDTNGWKHWITLRGQTAVVYVYSIILSGPEFFKPRTVEEEQVINVEYPLSSFCHNTVIPNLRWMLPLIHEYTFLKPSTIAISKPKLPIEIQFKE